MDTPEFTLMSESDIQASPLILNDRGLHGVFRLIRELSTPKKGEKLTLFDPESTRLDIAHFDQKSLPQVLKKLEKEEMVLSLPGIRYDSEEQALVFNQFYITRPAPDVGRIETIVDNVLRSSVNALQDWGRHSVKVESILDDLNSNWKRKQESYQILFSLSRALKQCERINSYPEKYLKLFTKEFAERLESSVVFRKITDDIYVPLVSGKTKFLYEACESFCDERIAPYLVNMKPDCCRDYRLAEMENRMAKSDERKRPAASATAAKARALIKEFADLESYSGAGSFLALRILVEMEKDAENAYEEEWKRFVREEAQAFIRTLNSHMGDWNRAIRFISATDVMELIPDVWKIIQQDTGLYHITWERPSSRYYVMMTGDPESFWIIFRGLMDLSGSENWKITAVKTLVERYEMSLSGMFKNPGFVKLYGKLLKKAYVQYMPFYLRPFMTWKIPFLHGPLFRRAKEKIEREQKYFGRQNQARIQAYYKKINESINSQNLKMMEQSYKNSLTATLDRVYLEDQKIPICSEMMIEIPEMDTGLFWRVIKEGGFRMVPAGGVKTPENQILIHPANGEWRTREVRVRKLIERIRVRDKLLGTDGDPLQADRAKRLEAFLDRTSGGSRKKEDDGDPYEKFQVELDREKASEME